MLRRITIANKEMKLDETKSTLLGFYKAGWEDFRKMLIEQGNNNLASQNRSSEHFTVHTTSDSKEGRILKESESFYWKSHGDKELKEKSRGKKKDPRSVDSARLKVLEFFCDLEHPESRKEIVKLIMTFINKDKYIDVAMKEIEEAKEPNKEMLSILITETQDGDMEGMEGYGFISFFRGSEHLYNTCLKHEKPELVEALKLWTQYVDLSSTPEDLQKSLANSKSMLTDTLQLNLKLLAEGKPLVPIYFVISSTEFEPAWKNVTDKVGHVFTNAEIRMTYKLMREINDPLITELMEKTVFFEKKTDKGFEQVQPPWESNPDMWANRVRRHEKKAYSERPADKLPQWVKDFKELANKTATTIQFSKAPTVQKLSVFSPKEDKKKETVKDERTDTAILGKRTDKKT